MQKIKKIEFIIHKPHLTKFIDLLEELNISGYTIVENVIGKGTKGNMMWDEITDSFKNSYVFILCEEDKVNNITEKTLPFLKKYGGICFISDSYIIEGRS